MQSWEPGSGGDEVDLGAEAYLQANQKGVGIPTWSSGAGRYSDLERKLGWKIVERLYEGMEVEKTAVDCQTVLV